MEHGAYICCEGNEEENQNKMDAANVELCYGLSTTDCICLVSSSYFFFFVA